MPLTRDSKFDSARDLFQEINRKALANELGGTSEECLINSLKILRKGESSIEHALSKFITNDPRMLAMKARISLIFPRPEPVLITGPTGVGKELLAKALTRSGEPFVSENCAGIPEALVESIFFGHVKGAFTGAHEDKRGLLEEAGEGIIFLDEIGDMPMNLQAKFLRAIQENEIRRVGSTNTVDLHCRFVAATKYDLESRMESGHFREDLFARLMTYQIKVTPLMERTPDIELITKSMIPNGKLDDLIEAKLWPFPEFIMEKIRRFNVRGIETALARRISYGSYDE